MTPMLVLQFFGFFLFILVLGYLLPAGQFFYKYYVRTGPDIQEHRIQKRLPTREQIHREIRMSVITVIIFAAMSTLLLHLYKAGWTQFYWRFRDYPLYYLPISLILCMIFHDTFFYWTHRFMHWRPVFKYMHASHHR